MAFGDGYLSRQGAWAWCILGYTSLRGDEDERYGAYVGRSLACQYLAYTNQILETILDQLLHDRLEKYRLEPHDWAPTAPYCQNAKLKKRIAEQIESIKTHAGGGLYTPSFLRPEGTDNLLEAAEALKYTSLMCLLTSLLTTSFTAQEHVIVLIDNIGFVPYGIRETDGFDQRFCVNKRLETLGILCDAVRDKGPVFRLVALFPGDMDPRFRRRIASDQDIDWGCFEMVTVDFTSVCKDGGEREKVRVVEVRGYGREGESAC